MILMRFRRFVPLLSIAAIAMTAATLALANPDKTEEKNTTPQSGIHTLINELADNDYSTRENATKKLWDIGPPALPALRKAAQSKEPEAASRAKELLLYIQAGVLSDSPEDVKTMVLKYSEANGEKKLSILQKLVSDGHWRQALNLAQIEPNLNIKNKILADIHNKVRNEARKAIATKNFNRVEEIIKLLGNSDQGLIMQAWFYKQRNQINAQLKAAAKIPGQDSARWRLALHRANGNIKGALKEAEALGDTQLVASLKLLQGNPTPWLKTHISTQNAIADITCNIQIALLQGEQKQAHKLTKNLNSLKENTQHNEHIIAGLAGTGSRDLAIQLMINHQELTAFSYFDNMEDPTKALKILGIIKPTKNNYADWIKKNTAQALEDREYSSYMKLFMLASFLKRHGESQHAMPMVKPLMDALKKDGSDVWFNLLYNMALFELGKEAIHLIQQRGNEDNEADKAIRTILRDLSENNVVEIWESLKNHHNQDLGKSLHEIAILSGLIPDPKNEVPGLQKRLLNETKQDVDIDEEKRLRAVLAFAQIRGDMQTCLDICQRKAIKESSWVPAQHYYSKELFQWSEIEPYYTQKVRSDPSDYRSLCYLYIALRKQGKNEQTGDILQRLLTLSMGNTKELNDIATEFYQAGLYKEATEIWLQSLTMAHPNSPSFQVAIRSLADSPQHLYDSKQWHLASAIAEAHIQLLARGKEPASIHAMLRGRFKAEFARGMHQLQQGQQKQALKTLNAARKLVPGDGTLADHFFPSIREARIGKIYDVWFKESYQHIAKASQLYPKSHNTHNTAAWLCSRSVRNLDTALEHSTKALEDRPHQGAYLDTMAEIWFAKGQRNKALQWSQKALHSSRQYTQNVFRARTYVFQNFQQLFLQFERFRDAPLPKAQ